MPSLPAFIPPKTENRRVDFDPRLFRDVVLNHGARLRWEMVAPCPCTERFTFGGDTVDPLRARPSCPSCAATPGFFYHSGQEIRGVLGSLSHKGTRFDVAGLREDGTGTLTVLPEHMPAYLDRVTAIERVIVYFETRERLATVEALRFPVARRSFAVGAASPPNTAETREIGVLYCRAADTSGTITGGELVEDVDFEVTAAGAIDWSLGDGLGTSPAVGNRYTIRYYAHPSYLITGFPYANRDVWRRTKSPAPSRQDMIVSASVVFEPLSRAA